MINQYRNIMTLVYILAHSNTLRRKRRGIQPTRDSKFKIYNFNTYE
jgi:hypothetical protein